MKDHPPVITQISSLRAWFQFYGLDCSAEDSIRSGLTEAGLSLCQLGGFPHGHGIVCFSELDAGLLEMIRNTRREARGMLIALAAPPLVPDAKAIWRLLEQGAAEVLAWDDRSYASSQVLARLERWTTVDELAEHAASRASLAGESQRWRFLVRKIADAGRFTDAPILLVGESGTGKEQLARLVSLVDSRAAGTSGDGSDLVIFDCSTIVPELSGSELFGHERGAFTGAVNSRDGCFAMANGKTLFLDEIGELPLPMQAQLLRAIQEKKYKRVGSNTWQSSDFRLVCATNKNLSQLIDEGKFRLDLYHRISGWVFQTVPLRERREDILPLARFFLREFCDGETPPVFDEAVEEYLVNREYPGNVRELRHLMQRIFHRHVGPGAITAGDIPEEDRPASGECERAWPNENFDRTISEAILLGAGLKEITQITTETVIRLAVQAEDGNLQRAATKLGVTDRALQMRKASGKISAFGAQPIRSFSQGSR